MRYADLTHRIAGESVDTWATHYEDGLYTGVNTIEKRRPTGAAR